MRAIGQSIEHSIVKRDETIVKAAKSMLGMVIKSDLPSSAQVISIAKLLHILERLPRIPDAEPMSVTLTSPRKRHREIETYFWWEVTWTEETVRVSGGGHYYHPSSGGDSFSVFYWEAMPGAPGEYLDYLSQLHMVPDVKDFELHVREMNLSEAGYQVEVDDDSNDLLNDDSDTDNLNENDEDSGVDNGNEEPVEWMAVACDAAEKKYCELINPNEVDNSEPIFAHGIDECGICGRLLSDCGLAIDGSLKGTSMWGNFCATCYARAGRGIGWGVGQLYARQSDGSWRLVAGFPH